jgi:predicted heme/steroid binding protein
MIDKINRIFPKVLLGFVITTMAFTSTYAVSILARSLVIGNGSSQVNEDLLFEPNTNSTSEKPTLTSTTNNSCIVTISGEKYDVSSLKASHSGGDIFNCGSDMTSVYKDEHGSNLSRMNMYLVTDVTNIDNTIESKVTNSTDGISTSELASHNTADSCYVAYSGTVYDVTNNSSWRNCSHHGVRGGADITSRFPHSESYISSLKIVGTYADGASASISSRSIRNTSEDDEDHDDNHDEDHDD